MTQATHKKGNQQHKDTTGNTACSKKIRGKAFFSSAKSSAPSRNCSLDFLLFCQMGLNSNLRNEKTQQQHHKWQQLQHQEQQEECEEEQDKETRTRAIKITHTNNFFRIQFFRLTSAYFLPRSSAILPLFFRDFDPHKLNNRHGSKSATTATTKNIIITMTTTMKKVITKLNTPTAWGNLRKFHSFFRDFFRGLEGIAAHVFSDRLRFWDVPCIYQVYSASHATKCIGLFK